MISRRAPVYQHIRPLPPTLIGSIDRHSVYFGASLVRQPKNCLVQLRPIPTNVCGTLSSVVLLYITKRHCTKVVQKSIITNCEINEHHLVSGKAPAMISLTNHCDIISGNFAQDHKADPILQLHSIVQREKNIA